MGLRVPGIFIYRKRCWPRAHPVWLAGIVLLFACNLSLSPLTWEARRELASHVCFVRGGPGEREFEVVSISGASIKAIRLDRNYVIDSFTPDFSGFAFTDSTKLPGWKHEFRHFVKLDGLPPFEVFRATYGSLSASRNTYSVVWMTPDGSSFIALYDGELSYFSRSTSSFDRLVISRSVLSAAVFGEDIYYSEAASPRALRKFSVDNTSARVLLYQSSEPLDYFVVAGTNAEFLVACRYALEDPDHQCRSINLRTQQERRLPKPPGEHISRIIPLKGTSKIVLLTSHGREWIGGSIAELHAVDLAKDEHSWVYDVYMNYEIHRLHPSFGAADPN